METVLVTGAAGFLGANLVRDLLAETPWRVVGYDALTYAGHRESLADLEAEPRFRLVHADVLDAAALARVVHEERPARIAHLAAETHVDRSIDDPRTAVRTNVLGTAEVLEAARAHHARLGAGERERFRVLHVSTDEVYGSLGPHEASDEDAAYRPRSPYAASKAGADHLALAWHATYGLPVVVSNAANTYGPFQFPEKLVPLATLNALEGRPIPLYGDGAQVRPWIHVRDHAAALRLLLERGRPGARYHVGPGEERTNVELVGAICAAVERVRPAAGNAALATNGVRRYDDLVTRVADRPGHDRRYALVADRIRDEVGWTPRRTLTEGLAETVRWYAEHGAWCEAVQAKGYRRERLGLPRVESAR